MSGSAAIRHACAIPLRMPTQGDAERAQENLTPSPSPRAERGALANHDTASPPAERGGEVSPFLLRQLLPVPPHWPETPPPPHVCGEMQLPQVGIRLPHPSPAGPQAMCCCRHVSGTQPEPS